MEIFAETDRLILRELNPDDAQGMFELDSDPEVHWYLGKNPVKSIEDSCKAINDIRRQYTENGIGRWAVIEKRSGKFLGWAGLKLMHETVNNYTNFHDIGYRFIRKYWGQGYATEAAAASRNYAFDVLKLENLYGMANIENIASRKVLLKTGLQYMGDFYFERVSIWHSWYELNREDYLKEKQQQ